ncbi:MAG: TonB-dependent receptor [Tannerella sp.]|jgi:TonB-linked SusC/RagA family outer membrane protein|nr:TonB-dependent receptor [Tannerella sp.]
MKKKFILLNRDTWYLWRKALCVLCILSCCSTAAFAQKRLTGTVTDATGETIIGANVVEKGVQPANGTVTDANGRFALTVQNNATLQVSYVGYITQEVKVGSQTAFTVTLVENTQALEEVVVVGYGTQRKVSVTGAVSSINTSEMKVSTSASLGNALAGRIAGLTSTQSIGGQPGRDDATMYLRGVATINGSSPLILIDGVPRDNIRTMDYNEVESISILKDASATSVFGVRGANGVLMITTKRGKAGKPELTVSATQSFSALTREPSRLHSLDYMKFRNEALINDGMESAIFSDETMALYADPLKGLDPSSPDYATQAATRMYMYPDNDYYRMMIKRWSPQHNINANLSGGTDKLTYFMNVSYLYQGGNLKTEPKEKLGYDPSSKLNRYSFRSNVDYNISKALKVYLNLGTYIEKVNMPNAAAIYGGDQNWMMRDLFFQAQTILPISPGPTTIAGHGVEAGFPLDPSYLDGGHYMDRSPYTIINKQGYLEETRSNLNSTIGTELDMSAITKGLVFKGMLSYDSRSQTVMYGAFNSSMYMANVDYKNNTLSFAELTSATNRLTLSNPSPSSNYTINAQASLNYNRSFELHNVGGMILAQRDYWETTGAEIPYNVLGIAGRAMYDYDSRYFAEFNMGYNGSEQFSPKKRFGFFPSFSAGWLITKESFLADNEYLTSLKVRASYGKVGNDKGQGRFLYQDNITMGGGFSSSLGQGRGVSEGLLGNPDITWEMATKMNLGIDFQIIKDISGTVDIFRENRTQILLTRASIPYFQGLPLGNVPKVNMGEMENQGFEIELGYNKQINSDLLVHFKGNFSYNRNKRMNVDEVPRDETYTYPKRSTGYSLGQNFGYLINYDQDGGYWTPEALADPNHLTYDFGTPRAGDFVYSDINGDGVVSEKDQAPIGYGSVPRISWGGSFNVEYKGFDVYAFLQGLGQYSSNFANQGVYESTIRGTYFDLHRTAWTEERWANGDKITYPALSTGQNVNHRANSFFVMDRTFARLKNIEFGYTLPKDALKLLGISKMRVFLQGQNVFTWSPNFPLTHLDPENNDAIGYPQTKMFSLGTNINF